MRNLRIDNDKNTSQVVFGTNLWYLTQTPQILTNLWCLTQTPQILTNLWCSTAFEWMTWVESGVMDNKSVPKNL